VNKDEYNIHHVARSRAVVNSSILEDSLEMICVMCMSRIYKLTNACLCLCACVRAFWISILSVFATSCWSM